MANAAGDPDTAIAAFRRFFVLYGPREPLPVARGFVSFGGFVSDFLALFGEGPPSPGWYRVMPGVRPARVAFGVALAAGVALGAGVAAALGLGCASSSAASSSAAAAAASGGERGGAAPAPAGVRAGEGAALRSARFNGEAAFRLPSPVLIAAAMDWSLACSRITSFSGKCLKS